MSGWTQEEICNPVDFGKGRPGLPQTSMSEPVSWCPQAEKKTYHGSSSYALNHQKIPKGRLTSQWLSQRIMSVPDILLLLTFRGSV